ncbi:MAG: transporter [Oleispira sp.]|nr:transporter [Oleispira sp.]
MDFGLTRITHRLARVKSGMGFLALLGAILPCSALEIEPRLWSHLPIGANFIGGGYAHSELDIYLDPALLLEDVEMELDTWVGKYIHSFELFNHSTRIDVKQAYQEGKWTGLLDGVPASTSRSGMSDTFVRIGMNVYGAPPLSAKPYRDYRALQTAETIVGISVAIRLPTGNYHNKKLINLGQNRYVVRPQVGVMHTRGKWSAELTGEVSIFGDNNEFYNGNKLEQEPLYITHAHLVYTLRPGVSAIASVGYDYGGESRINGINKHDRNQNLGWALKMNYPLNRTTGLSMGYVNTKTKGKTGFDSETVAAGLSYMF